MARPVLCPQLLSITLKLNECKWWCRACVRQDDPESRVAGRIGTTRPMARQGLNKGRVLPGRASTRSVRARIHTAVEGATGPP